MKKMNNKTLPPTQDPQVKYKRIVDSFGDAPFLGALLIAPSCTRGCPGCQNTHLKEEETILEDAKTVGEAIKINPFWDGIILGGLEPLDDKDNFIPMMEVVRFSEVHKLFIYTSFEIEDVPFDDIPLSVTKLYVKTGRYLQNSPTAVVYKLRNFELELASANQQLRVYDRDILGDWKEQRIEIFKEEKNKNALLET